jgi:hypothetical protein
VTGCQTPELPFGQDKIGTYSVQATRKWSSVFAYYQDVLGLPDHRTTFSESSINTQASWEHLAIQINQVLIMSSGLSIFSFSLYPSKKCFEEHLQILNLNIF